MVPGFMETHPQKWSMLVLAKGLCSGGAREGFAGFRSGCEGCEVATLGAPAQEKIQLAERKSAKRLSPERKHVSHPASQKLQPCFLKNVPVRSWTELNPTMRHGCQGPAAGTRLPGLVPGVFCGRLADRLSVRAHQLDNWTIGRLLGAP